MYLRILFLHLQSIFEQRLRSFIYLLISVFNSVIFLLFWYGSLKSGRMIGGWDIQAMTTYYLFLIIAGAMLIAHVEYDIAYFDIHEGEIVKYLVRPFSYTLFKLYTELPFRLLQGFYGLLILLGWIVFVGPLKLVHTPGEILLTIIIWILAFCLSFMFKLSISLLTFWFEEVWGLFQLCEMLILVFGGFTMPLDLLPDWVYQLAMKLPFASMCYFPVLAISGRLSGGQWTSVINSQLIWILVFYCAYKTLWVFGTKKFSGVGQ
jgi:ABC-2 type transport system permease protein